MIKKNQAKTKKILFYTSVPRLFRTTLIGHLYEITRVYPVVLLAEKLDSETEEILQDKKMFPKLKEIIRVGQYTDKKTSWFVKNIRLFKLAKDVIQRYKPDVVITENDIYLFELYLMRFAKKIGAVNICFQSGIKLKEMNEEVLKYNLMNVYLKTPFFLPFSVRLFFIKLEKTLKHLLFYWIFPLIARELPFKGKSSFILWPGVGLRDSDYLVVFSQTDYGYYLKDGVPAEKLFILSHPLKRENTRRFFKKIYFSNLAEKRRVHKKTLTLILSEEPIAFRRSNCSLVPKEEIRKNRREIIALIAEILKGWKIFIKPHPSVQDTSETKRVFGLISDCIEVTKPSEPIDKYIEISDAIIGFSPPSTVLFTASLQCPEKIILSIDLEHELLGDCHKNFDGIEYISNKEKLVNILKLIQRNKYHKRYSKGGEANGFQSAVEVLEYIFKSKNKTQI